MDEDLEEKWFFNKSNIGITAGASSPEILIEEIVYFLNEKFKIYNIETIRGAEENISFKPIRQFS